MKKYSALLVLMLIAVTTLAASQNSKVTEPVFVKTAPGFAQQSTTAQGPDRIEQAANNLTTSAGVVNSVFSDRRDPPANDACEQAELVTGPFPVELSGTVAEATVDCPGLLDWNAVWYAIELPYDSQHLIIDWCDTPDSTEITNYGIVYMDDCACDNYVAGNYYWGCGNDNLILTWNAIPGPITVYFPLYIEGAAEYTIVIDVEEYFAIPGNYCYDPFLVDSLPYQFSGTTSDNTHTYGNHLSPDEWHRFTLAAAEQVTISLCGGGTNYDAFLYLLSYDCLTELAANDDFCELQSELTIQLDPGVYQVCVAGYGINHGNYLLDITLSPPCSIQCPPGSVAEGEVDCFDGYFDVVNGGCNSSPPLFGTIEPAEIICGTAGTFLYEGVNYRDTDWYNFALAESSRVSLVSETEFPAALLLLDAADCDSLQVVGEATGNPCQPFAATAILPPGDYSALIAPTLFFGVECGAEYYLELNVADLNNGETIEFALPLTLGDCVANNTSGFINDYDEVCPYTGSTSPDVVYTFFLDYVTDLLFDMCESGYDTKLYVYNSALELIGCSDDDCENSQGNPYRSTIAVEQLAVDRYYVVCDGWGGASGDFELCVTGGDPPEFENCQTAHTPDDAWSTVISHSDDAGTDLLCADRFGDGGEISGLQLWGLSRRYDEGWIDCFEDPVSFAVTFYEDLGLPGDAVVSWQVATTPQPTWEYYDGSPLYRFNLELTPPCLLEQGWVSVQTSGECWFLWMSGEGSDGWCAISEAGGSWQVSQQDRGWCLIINQQVLEPASPATIILHNNHPNPFNPVTNISFDLSAPGQVELSVFNVTGEQVVTLVKGLQGAGQHVVQFDGNDLPSGIYFYTLMAGSFRQTERMLLVK